jgi:DNA-binding transcriptional MerR regulator
MRRPRRDDVEPHALPECRINSRGSPRSASSRPGGKVPGPPTIRYYEEIGLLRPADRGSSGQRTYDDGDVKRLIFVRRCREFGFSIEQVRSLVALVEDRRRSCMDARDLAQQHLMAVRERLVELRALERSIERFVANCDMSCAGGPGPDCVTLEDLSTEADDRESGQTRRPERLHSVKGTARRRPRAGGARRQC